ncbi:hypothetical protein PFJ87_08g00500 [Encephalitozoon hellem]|uniref:Uncharacterized protein n=1 Tax=Encephalitozoon hellem TaxID=27973 RepID=A0ABY8CQC4_ENCHE|nr:hypothetical protein PFJ87_08g00500 [Encephalitozoon hellem]
METSSKTNKARENLKEFQKKAKDAYKSFRDMIEKLPKKISIYGVEIESSGALGLALIFTPIVLSILGISSHLSMAIAVIGYLTAIALSLFHATPKVYKTCKKYKESHDIWELVEFKNLMLFFQIIFGMFLLLHLLYITDENCAEGVMVYGLMISLIYLSRLAWKMSNFSIKKDDFYKIIVLLAGLVSINLITFVARKEISKPHIIISSLLSAVIILSNCVGKPITEKEEEAEPLSAIAALLPIITVIYVTACACRKFRIPLSQESFRVV